MSSSTKSELDPRRKSTGLVGDSRLQTSRSLIVRVRENEERAWEQLVHLFAPLVYHWSRRAGLQEHDTEDVFQEVFETVHAHVRSFRHDRPNDTFRGWLFTITRNKIRDHFRRKTREPIGEGGSDALRRMDQVEARDRNDGTTGSESGVTQPELRLENFGGLEPDPSADAGSERALIRRVLELVRGEFRERTWRAFWRTTVDDRPAPEVASELGMTSGAVRVAKFRVLRRVKQELGDTS